MHCAHGCRSFQREPAALRDLQIARKPDRFSVSDLWLQQRITEALFTKHGYDDVLDVFRCQNSSMQSGDHCIFLALHQPPI